MNLNQVSVPSTDLMVSVPFYEKLGLTLIVDDRPQYVRFECPDGASTFSIHQVKKRSSGEGVIVYFECDDLDQYVGRLLDAGIEFEEFPEYKSWLWKEAKLKDPDGNQLVLFYGGNNRKDPPWRVK